MAVRSFMIMILTLAFVPCGIGQSAPAAPPASYAISFVSTAAFGASMNDAGDVAGKSYPNPGCGSSCLPPLETVVWRGGVRIVLPSVPGLTGTTAVSINAQGWVAGFAGLAGTKTHAVLWKPSGSLYTALDLGVLPGTTISYAVGIDDLGRVVGWSTTSNFPPNGSPFMWSAATGMVDLSALGFPDEVPLAISPGGAVATQFNWYRLGNPNSVVPMPLPPLGFVIGTESTAINDSGDQARFLIRTSTQNLRYLFRFHHTGTWQQIGFTGNGSLARYGVGSITISEDVTATDLGTAEIAYGPNGLAQSLTPLLSPAYQGAAITGGGPINRQGQILAQVMIGRSPRLVRLTPIAPCTIGCARVTTLQLTGQFISDPNNPGQCTPLASDHVVAKLTITDQNGAPLNGVAVTGHFLDDYWLDHQVSATTGLLGRTKFVHNGPACVGAIAFLVDRVSKVGVTFDRSTGVLTRYVIPVP